MSKTAEINDPGICWLLWIHLGTKEKHLILFERSLNVKGNLLTQDKRGKLTKNKEPIQIYELVMRETDVMKEHVLANKIWVTMENCETV